MTYERDFYSVNPDHTITLHGWLDERDNNIEGFEHDLMPRHTFVSGDWPEFNNLEEPLVDWAAQFQQYNEDIHYDDVPRFLATFFDGEPGTHLPLAEVNDETPAGNYWCTFDEEEAPVRVMTIDHRRTSETYLWGEFGTIGKARAAITRKFNRFTSFGTLYKRKGADYAIAFEPDGWVAWFIEKGE